MLDQAFLASVKNGDHFEDKKAWNEAQEITSKCPIVPSYQPIQKLNTTTVFRDMSLMIDSKNTSRCVFYILSKYKLVYDKFIWTLYNNQTKEVLAEHHVFDHIIPIVLALKD